MPTPEPPRPRAALDRWIRRLAVIAVTAAGSVASFGFLLELHPPPWRTTEYAGIGLWSVPEALVILAFGAPARRWLTGRPPLLRVAAALGIAVLSAVLWTFAAYFASGGYIMAFDANPLFSWMGGAIGGSLVSMLWPDMWTPRPAAEPAA
jgi:hypothetical protein